MGRRWRWRWLTAAGGLLLGVALLGAPASLAAQAPRTLTGTLDGADYLIEVPANWNGTLLLYSHGTVRPGAANTAQDAPDALSGPWLLNAGYALAGSAYSKTGYALAEAFHDNIALLDTFAQSVGKPKRTIAWGTSQGGMISAGLAQKFPDRFDGALPMCGFLAGAVGQENVHLDSAFVMQQVLPGGSSLPIVNIPDGDAATSQAQALVADAQATPAGRARLALAAAVGNVPGWYDPSAPPPATDDYAAQEAAQFQWFTQTDLDFYLFNRAELEQRAGGNVSWNTGVDYRQQLERSIDRNEVYGLYAAAGLSLDDDLRTLATAPRIEADPGAVQYLVDNVVYNGQLQIPVLTLHTLGDGRRIVGEERAYADVVHAAGRDALLRQSFVARAGHCTYTAAEKLSALHGLMHRLDTGQWDTNDAATLNARAAALGPELNMLPPSTPLGAAFADATPAPFPRPWDARCLTATPAAPLPGEQSPLCL